MSEFDKMLKKVISGGQTGADIAALDTAIDLGLQTGGWMPPDGRNSAGVIPEVYGLVATPSEFSSFGKHIPRSLRTEWNVRDSDGTLIVAYGEGWDRGTTFTQQMCAMLDRSCLIAEIDSSLQSIHNWIADNGIETLNIAGPKISPENTEVSDIIQTFLLRLLSEAIKKP